jgi:hypothetical protein
MFSRASRRRRSARLRSLTQALPRHTREAMLRTLDEDRIIVGAYTDRDGGVCPMLGAHRNGGRTDFASFARAWDEFTGAGKRSRPATRRELGTLRSYLELSLLADRGPDRSRPAPRRVPDRFRVYDLRRLRRRGASPGGSDAPQRMPARVR